MTPLKGPCKIKGIIQHYSWGGYRFIPALLGENNPGALPAAEYWLGAHPRSPALVAESGVPLDRLIQEAPGSILGEEVAQRFGSLPYLLKVLDVRQMLSIQVHPSLESAAKGFEAENSAGIPLDAPHRNYKDRNHKPELMVALGDFWLLHGFKQARLLEEKLAAVPELAHLVSVFTGEGYEGLYRTVMSMSQEEADRMLRPLVQRLLPLYGKRALQKDSEDFWAARAAMEFCKDSHIDRGIFSVYFFNLVHLKKGEAIFQPEGMPHAYLEGQNVEVMANSDNVLRAGLTDKHIDVPELMKHVRFEPTVPQVIRSSGEEALFPTPAKEFALLHYEAEAGTELTLRAGAPEIWLLLDGGATVHSGGASLPLQRGEAAFIPAGTTVLLKAEAGMDLFRVSVPGDEKTG